MELNEAKQILKNNGYKLIKESTDVIQKDYNWNGSEGKLSVSFDKNQNIWVSITNEERDESFTTEVLPTIFDKIESEYGLTAKSAQDFPIGTNGFNSVVIYKAAGNVDLNALADTIYAELNNVMY